MRKLAVVLVLACLGCNGQEMPNFLMNADLEASAQCGLTVEFGPRPEPPQD